MYRCPSTVGETASLASKFYLSVASRTVVKADPSLNFTFYTRAHAKEREGERERQTHRQTDRQTDGQKDRD